MRSLERSLISRMKTLFEELLENILWIKIPDSFPGNNTRFVTSKFIDVFLITKNDTYGMEFKVTKNKTKCNVYNLLSNEQVLTLDKLLALNRKCYVVVYAPHIKNVLLLPYSFVKENNVIVFDESEDFMLKEKNRWKKKKILSHFK